MKLTREFYLRPLWFLVTTIRAETKKGTTVDEVRLPFRKRGAGAKRLREFPSHKAKTHRL